MIFLKILNRVVLAASAFSLGAAGVVHANDAQLRERLQLFQQNSALAMKQVPEKRSKSGKKTVSKFSAAQVKSRAFIAAKNEFRDVLSGRSAFKSNDAPEKLVDYPEDMLTSIEDMDT